MLEYFLVACQDKGQNISMNSSRTCTDPANSLQHATPRRQKNCLMNLDPFLQGIPMIEPQRFQ